MHCIRQIGCDRRAGFSPPPRAGGLKPTLHSCAMWLVLLTMAAPGCENGPKTCNDITPGAIPQPSGSYLCQWNHAETARADRDKFVIYQYEWAAEPTTLTPGGREHLDCLSQGLAQSTCPIVIETSQDDRLDAARREAIVRALAGKNVLLALDRVIVGRSEAEGLYGQEAPGVSAEMLSNQGGAGAAGGAGAMGGGATGAMGGASTSGGGGMGLY